MRSTLNRLFVHTVQAQCSFDIFTYLFDRLRRNRFFVNHVFMLSICFVQNLLNCSAHPAGPLVPLFLVPVSFRGFGCPITRRELQNDTPRLPKPSQENFRTPKDPLRALREWFSKALRALPGHLLSCLGRLCNPYWDDFRLPRQHPRRQKRTV